MFVEPSKVVPGGSVVRDLLDLAGCIAVRENRKR